MLFAQLSDTLANRLHASSELAAEIDSALETTESHLKKIRDLMDDKKDDDNK